MSIPFAIFLLPETKNIPLEEMDRLWNEKNTWRANQIVMAELQRENATASANPAYLHQEKPAGSQERFERSSSSEKA